MKDEYKGKMELCYSRAANAGAAALKMLQNLSKHDSKFPDDTHIPPVVTLTTTHDVEMQLIWSGSLTRMVDIFELRAILENCQTWATRVLRPWISRQIDLWKQQCPDDCPRPFDASLRHRVAKSRNSGLRPARDEDAPEREPKKNENKDADLRQIIREEHDRLLKQLSQASVETKRPTRSIATQTGPDAEGHPLEKSAVRPMTLDSARPFPRKILEPKPRLAKKIATSGPSLSSAKGETAPARARQETNDGTRLGDSVDLFKSTKKVYGKRRIFTIKLPDVSSEEILAQKPWLGVKKSSERDRQAKTVLTQKSQEKKAEVEEDPAEKDKVKKQDDDGTRNENNTTEENGAKGKSDYNKDDNGDDNRVDHEKGKEDEPKVPLIEAMEENYWRSILTTDDKEDPPNDATEAAPIPADEDAKEDSNPQPLTCSKDSSTRTTEMAKNERSSEIAKKENPKESIKIDRPEEIPENNHDEIIEKGNSEKLVQKGEKANSEGIVEGENPKDSISKDISKESAKHENPKETTENEDSGKGLVRENSDQDPQNMPTKSPLPTPEPEPADPLSPNPPAPAGQWAWLKDYGQNKDDNHKGLGQPTIKQDTTPPLKDGSSTFKAVKGILSPPAETNPSAVFDAAQWTDTKFAFGTSAHVMGARFTFQMKTEGGAEDPRNSSMPENQAKATRIFTWPRNQTNAERLFEWLEEHDDEPIPDENPLPLKLVKGGREFGASVERHTAKGDAEPQFLKTPESDTGSNSGPGNNDSQSGGGDGPALSSSKGNDKTRQDGGSRGASSRNQDGS
ncbi:hypothetical protein N0V84_003195 [Fusarium piperis]|uniref:Uncharacterized protein n=1 Tax=Fusarium piperis TaxID=1435070 RepID=A0A9W8WI39_9HYPO|nr:hypothetical protein N0V84_003195 [Fusarium piperis]